MIHKKNPALTYRNELKFICTTEMITLLRFRLQQVLCPDIHGTNGSYRVTSLYYDDWNRKGCHDNDLGISSRSKYRIRMYNRDPNTMRLEQKIKYNNKCAKRSEKLSVERFEQICRGNVSGFLYDPVPPVLRDFVLKVQLTQLSPAAIIDYVRTAFTYEPGNVRITLDTFCSVSFQTDAFMNRDPALLPIQEENLHLLEVKYDDFMPDYIRQTLQMNTLRQVSFSKYYLGMQTIQDYWR